MNKFALVKNRFARGERQIFNLVIRDTDQFEEFENRYNRKQYLSELKTIAARIALISQGRRLAAGQVRKIKGHEKAWEIKTRNLRLYYCNIDGYDIILCRGGQKKNQKSDIAKLRRIIREIKQQITTNGKLKIRNKQDR